MKWIYSGFAVGVTIALLTFPKIAGSNSVQNLRLQTFDALQQLDEEVISNDIVLINIGEEGVEKLEGWSSRRADMVQTFRRGI